MYVCCVVLRDRDWNDIPWQKVVVGDIVKVVDRQFFPADLVLLASRYGECTGCYMYLHSSLSYQFSVILQCSLRTHSSEY